MAHRNKSKGLRLGEVEERNGRKKGRLLFHRGGVTYFSKKTERTFFFILTIAMLVWGVLVKLDFF